MNPAEASARHHEQTSGRWAQARRDGRRGAHDLEHHRTTSILATAGPTNLTLVTFLIPIGTLLVGALALGVVDGRLPAAIGRLRRSRLASAQAAAGGRP